MAELETKLDTKMEPAEAGKDTLYLGDAIEFFLRSKRSGGRSGRPSMITARSWSFSSAGYPARITTFR